MIQRRLYRSFLSYIDLSREYYTAHGYSKPYRWISHQNVPFTKLEKPLPECRVALPTTTDLEKLPGDSVQERHLSRKVYAQHEDETWRKVFMHVAEEKRKAYKKAGEARRAEQAKVKAKLKKKV